MIQIQNLQKVVDCARKDWGVKKKITLELDDSDLSDPFTLGCVHLPKPKIFLYGRQIEKLNPSRSTIVFCIYHEMGHHKQWESRLFRKYHNVDNIARSTYDELTNELSTIMLLHKKKLSKYTFANLNYIYKLTKTNSCRAYSEWFLEYWPYLYAFKKASDILNDSELKKCYAKIKKLLSCVPINIFEKGYDILRIHRRGPVYYLKEGLSDDIIELCKQIYAANRKYL